MTLDALKTTLAAQPDLTLAIQLPDGDRVPAHFHLTEVGHVTKRFIDCGGEVHHEESCLLQVWVADDRDHRLSAEKVLRVLAMFERLSPAGDLPVEVEYEDCAISHYPVLGGSVVDGEIVLELGEKHTDCRAKEACGLTPTGQVAGSNCCAPGSGCC